GFGVKMRWYSPNGRFFYNYGGGLPAAGPWYLYWPYEAHFANPAPYGFPYWPTPQTLPQANMAPGGAPGMAPYGAPYPQPTPPPPVFSPRPGRARSYVTTSFPPFGSSKNTTPCERSPCHTRTGVPKRCSSFRPPPFSTRIPCANASPPWATAGWSAPDGVTMA